MAVTSKTGFNTCSLAGLILHEPAVLLYSNWDLQYHLPTAHDVTNLS